MIKDRCRLRLAQLRGGHIFRMARMAARVRRRARADGTSRRGVQGVLSASIEGRRSEGGIAELLHAVRTHLDMDVAFVSEFVDERRVFRHVDSADPDCPIQAGASDPLEESYCQRVIDGRLPELIPDTSALPTAVELPATAALPVGAHLSVPIILSDGRRYGTFCCFSARADLSLNERDLAMMRVFAELAAHRIEADERERQSEEAALARLRGVLSGDGLTTVFQPIVDLRGGQTAGYEALSRFAPGPVRPPDVWFAEAHRVGLEVDLDLAAIASAGVAAGLAPAGVYLAVNLAPATIISGRLTEALASADPARTVLEITEHAVIHNYDEVAAALDPLRAAGFRVAVDDAGAGYASLHHILRLQPEIIKLDMSLTRGVDGDPARRALASAMVTFAADTGATVVAEGVETAEERATLIDVGVSHGQGHYLGRPAALVADGATNSGGGAAA